MGYLMLGFFLTRPKLESLCLVIGVKIGILEN